MSDVEPLSMQDQPELDDQLLSFPGHLLRQARESLNLSQKEAARDLHLTPKVINAIEEDDFSLIPSTLFARGYIRSYARHVGLDGQPLVEAFDAVYGVPNHASKPMSTIRNPDSQSKPSDTWVKLVSIMFVVGLLVASVIWWQSQNGGLISPQLTNTAINSTADETLINGIDGQEDILDLSILVTNQSEVDATAPVEQADTAIDLSLQSEAVVVKPIVDEVQEPVAAPVQEPVAAPVQAPVAEPEPASVVQALDQAQLVMVFNQDCWVEIKDGNDKMILSDLYSAGDTIIQLVTVPVKVLLGRASGVEKFTFDGRLIDLEPHTRKDIARLTLSK